MSDIIKINSQLWCNENAGFGLQIVFTVMPDGTEVPSNFFVITKARNGSLSNIVGLPDGAQGEYKLMGDDGLPNAGRWPQPSKYTIPRGRAVLTREGDFIGCKLIDFTPETGAQPSPLPPPINTSFKLHCLTV